MIRRPPAWYMLSRIGSPMRYTTEWHSQRRNEEMYRPDGEEEPATENSD